MTNAKGTVWYGLHFYPGVAEYRPAGKEPFRVFLNEDTIRSMDPTFAGCPVFVLHVDEVEKNIDRLRQEADGWVIESFFNKADGKHWVKFVIVSEHGHRSIKRGMRLSNAYQAKTFAPGGVWNGLDYDREVKGGDYDHLALVPDPRYDESLIMTPDEFKAYNEEKLAELQRLENSKTKETAVKGKFSFFKRAKIENAADLEEMMVVLPKSKYEASVAQILNEMDEHKEKRNDAMAEGAHHVMVGEHKMTVNDLVEKYNAMCNELADLKKQHGEGGDEAGEDAEHQNEDDEAKKRAEAEEREKTKNAKEAEDKRKKDEEKTKAKERADRLRNARERDAEPAPRIEVMEDQLERGKARYGS